MKTIGIRYVVFVWAMATSVVAAALPTLSGGAQQDTVVRSIDDVVVTGVRQATASRNLPMTVSVVDREALTEHERQNILPTLMEQVPGMFVTSRGMMGYGVSTGAAGGVNMRGLSSGMGQLLVLVDGQPQYNGIYGHSMADSYQTLMADRVEVLRGPASVLYGSNAMGGVINIVTRQPRIDGVNTHVNLGAGSWGTFQAEASNQVRHGRFTSTVAAQYGRTDNHCPRMGFEQYGAFVKLGYEISSHWRTFGNLNITHFNASNPVRVDISKTGITIGDLYEGNMWITRGVASVGLENRYEGTNGRVSAYSSWGYHKINDGYGPTYHNNTPQTTLFRSRDALTGVSSYQSASFFSGNILTVGFDYQNIYANAYYTDRKTNQKLPSTKATVDKRMDEFAVYADIHQDFAPWLSANAGVRYDYHTRSGSEWVPQAGLVVRPLPAGELKLTAGKGFRNPTAKDMFLYGMANADLKPERLWNYELAWRHRLDIGLNYGLNLFFIDGDNMIQAVSGKNVNTGELRNSGAEFDAVWRINSHWLLQTNHSYLHMRHRLIGAPKYKGNLGASARYGRWIAIAGLQQITGLYTAAGISSDPRESFTLLNATVGYQASPFLRLWVKGDNLFAQRYEINAGYPMPRATFMAGLNLRF